MSFYSKHDNSFWPDRKEKYDLYEKLPAAFFTLRSTPLGQFFFEETLPFSLPKKMYGENQLLCDRIYSTYEDRVGSTGVILSGEKGSGKTLLAKTLALRAVRNGVPVIIINSPFSGEEFNMLIQGIDQPCIIIFDEFEKIYDHKDSQNGILSLLDGLYNSKKMFILTVNEPGEISQYYFNRPGRLFYNIKFSGLSEFFIREYCKDNLKDQSRTEEIVDVLELVSSFNFDMLQSLIEEMNRYNESARDSLQFLNIEIGSTYRTYDVIEFVLSESKQIQQRLEFFNTKYLSLDLTEDTNSWYINYRYTDADGTDKYKHQAETYFYPTDILEIDKKTGIYSFKNPDGDLLKIKKAKNPEKFNLFNFLSKKGLTGLLS
jgi:hypothetical protein